MSDITFIPERSGVHRLDGNEAVVAAIERLPNSPIGIDAAPCGEWKAADRHTLPADVQFALFCIPVPNQPRTLQQSPLLLSPI
ncbi:unnamed protein product, partial [Iphiclides podalirius]